jgi:TM2 domain-containing membrane protein YozV
MSEELKPVQKKMVVAIVCWLFGWTGAHRMMMGYPKWWLHLLLSFCFGIGWIWALIDLVKILMGSLKMHDGRDLE